VCAQPLHTGFNRASALVEWLEFHRLLGVSHFIFYNSSIGADVQRVLRVYQRRGVVTVLPWHLNLWDAKGRYADLDLAPIHIDGQLAALNDCVYRTMYRYRYTMAVDTDEYIVPRQHADYTQMLRQLNRQRVTELQMNVFESEIGAFMFRSSFFSLLWENDPALNQCIQLRPEAQPPLPKLQTLLKTRRQAKPFPTTSAARWS